MLKDAFQLLLDTGVNSAPQIVNAEREPQHVYYVRQADGTLKKTIADRRPSKHAAYSLDAIIAIAKAAKEATVWFGGDSVVATFGDDEREQITMRVVHSVEYLRLREHASNRIVLAQADAVRELRTTFRNSLAKCGDIVNVLRVVNFKATATTQGEVGHGKASLGKAVTGELTGAGTIPEYLTFNVPVYANPCFRSIRADIECALEPDAATGTFRIIPLPQEIENAHFHGMQCIRQELEEGLNDSNVDVHYGSVS